MNTKIITAVFLTTFLHISSGLFFGPTRSSCRSDRDCTGLFSSRIGKCLNRRNFFCDVGNLFSNRRSQNNCSYRSCAQCLNDVDCFGDQYCSQGSCITRTRNYNNYNNYNYGSSGSFGSSAGVGAGSSSSSGGIPSSWLRG